MATSLCPHTERLPDRMSRKFLHLALILYLAASFAIAEEAGAQEGKAQETKIGKDYVLHLPFKDEIAADKLRCEILFTTGMTWNSKHITPDMIDDIVLDWDDDKEEKQEWVVPPVNFAL